MKTITLFQSGMQSMIKPLELLERCGGYYECPKDSDGNRLGPLVGYTGRDESGRQHVGDVYINFAKAERHAQILWYFGKKLADEIHVRGYSKILKTSTGFCGAPEGGKALACQMAQTCSIYGSLYGGLDNAPEQYIFPEKKIFALATPASREISELVFDRHEPEEGEKWWVVEDVCNNFSTTFKLITLLEKYGASVVGILCFLNRSLEVDSEYGPYGRMIFPVIPIVRKPFPQYTQDDPAVSADVKAGNVIWKPKNEWSRLAEVMKRSVA